MDTIGSDSCLLTSDSFLTGTACIWNVYYGTVNSAGFFTCICIGIWLWARTYSLLTRIICCEGVSLNGLGSVDCFNLLWPALFVLWPALFVLKPALFVLRPALFGLSPHLFPVCSSPVFAFRLQLCLSLAILYLAYEARDLTFSGLFLGALADSFFAVFFPIQIRTVRVVFALSI